MGCGSSSPGRVDKTQEVKTAMQRTASLPPVLQLSSRVRSVGNIEYSPKQYDSQSGLSTGSIRDWRDVVSFQTFMTQTDNPQIFEYEFLRSIGRGAQAEVYLVRNVETGILLAAKVYDKAFLYRVNLGDAEQPIQKTVREIQIMSTLKHPNCMGLVEVLDDDYTNSVIIITQFADAGSLLPQRSKTDPIPEAKARFYFYQIASGLQHIHSHNIIHRDIKPENIMMFSDGRVTIADFSASIILDSSDAYLEDTDGTPAFYSPEQCTGQPYLAKPTDIWATGISLYIMLYGKLPFFDVSEDGFFLSQFFRIAKQIQNDEVSFDPSIEVSSEAKDLILHMLDKNPTTRYNVDQVLEHKWLAPCIKDPEILKIENQYLINEQPMDVIAEDSSDAN